VLPSSRKIGKKISLLEGTFSNVQVSSSLKTCVRTFPYSSSSGKKTSAGLGS